MKLAICSALAMVFGLVGVAAADYEAFHVQVNPALGTLRYEAASMASGSLGCGEDPFVCMFDLELDMRLQLDGLGKAQATVSKLELLGLEGVFAEYPETVDYLELNLKFDLARSEFFVSQGPGVDDTTVTAQFPLSEPLVMQFHRAQLMTMSGGPDYRPVDGPKYTFGYTVPEPSTFVLGLIVALGCCWCCIARRGGTR
ncbi:MAG: hypothetical protein SGJ19_23435 [Planctomycetia bacterium]|nr:hypothetical protein [Planctomycetia bacterium]